MQSTCDKNIAQEWEYLQPKTHKTRFLMPFVNKQQLNYLYRDLRGRLGMEGTFGFIY